MNEDYESVKKEIDEMLKLREIDEFLEKIKKKNKIKNKERDNNKNEKMIELNKNKCLKCEINNSEDIKEEIFDLPKTLEKEIYDLYEEKEINSEKPKKMIKIDWKKELNLK
jgi:hypothetical protein